MRDEESTIAARPGVPSSLVSAIGLHLAPPVSWRHKSVVRGNCVRLNPFLN